jgi:glycosyltransferase involved in cell wall biosynthesis
MTVVTGSRLRPRPAGLPTVSVVVAAFADERWPQTVRAMESVQSQTYPALEIVLVIDHNPNLLARASAHFTDVRVTENAYGRGASGARNSGIDVSRGEVVAFLDDDAVADPHWLAESLPHFECDDVVGVGGRLTPLWEGERPAWFPQELLWTVGATYRGMPTATSQVRNVWAGNMLVRRAACEAVGGFRLDFGKRGDREDFQAEDTEFCLRTAAAGSAGSAWLYEPRAIAAHHVPARRSTWPFLVARCFHEGRNKVIMADLLESDITGRERSYILRTLPVGMLQGLTDLGRGDVAGAARTVTLGCCMVSGVLGAAAGVLRRRLDPQGSRAARTDDVAGHEVPPPQPAGDPESADVVDGPVLVTEVDLADLVSDWPVWSTRSVPSGQPWSAVHLLVRFASEPLGVVELPYPQDRAELAASVWRAFGAEVGTRMAAVGLTAPVALPDEGIGLREEQRRSLPWLRGREDALATGPTISVVICTRDPDGLEVSLTAAAALDYPFFEIVLVDNASTTDAARRLVESRTWDVPVRYVVEPRPGLSRARNAGVRVATGDLVAFLDDDETPDRQWLAEYARAFHDVPDAGAASGLILARSLDTAAQRFFEGLGGHSKGRGFERRVFDQASHATQHPLYPMPPFGAGGNICFRREVLHAIGGFDEALGAGTFARGGEDTAAFADAMLAGFTTVWQPSAFVRHDHYDSFDGAAEQLRGYGMGLTAFYARMVAKDPHRSATLLRLAVRAIDDLRQPGRTLIGSHAQSTAPAGLRRAQWTGLLKGPVAYLRSRARVRAEGRIAA